MLALFSFLAGVLTVLSPCVLPVLPVIISSGVGAKNYRHPLLVILGLTLSLFVFTVFIKSSTLWFNAPNIFIPFRFPASGTSLNFWVFVSAIILILLGVFYLKPEWWQKISQTLKIGQKSEKILQNQSKKNAWFSPLLTGFALGGAFSSCSPTYVLLLSVVLPNNFQTGLVYILCYCLGLSAVLFLIALLGNKISSKMRFLADDEGKLKKILGYVFVFSGVAILLGFDKFLETIITQFLVANNLDITSFEEKIRPKGF